MHSVTTKPRVRTFNKTTYTRRIQDITTDNGYVTVHLKKLLIYLMVHLCWKCLAGTWCTVFLIYKYWQNLYHPLLGKVPFLYSDVSAIHRSTKDNTIIMYTFSQLVQCIYTACTGDGVFLWDPGLHVNKYITKTKNIITQNI